MGRLLIDHRPPAWPTTRIIADRITPPNQVITSATQAMSRTSHTSLTTITDVRLVLGNYYSRNWNGFLALAADTAPGAPATVTAGIEYPIGTFRQALFSGVATGTIPDGDILISDSMSLSIPDVTQFRTLEWRQCAAGITCQGSDMRVGLDDAMRIGTSGVADQTMGGTITSNSGLFLPPVAIVGTSTRPSVAIIGASIDAGVGGTVDPGDVRHGFTKFLTTTPCINLAQGGADTLGWISDHPIHQKMLQFCTAMLTNHGANDYSLADTATCIARLQTLYALMPGKQIFQTTMIPRVTSSSDVWTTIEGQSGKGGSLGLPAFEAAKALNQAIRGGQIPGITAVFDTNSVLESGFESGWWRVATDAFGNGPPFTLDGSHPTESGFLAMRDSGIVDQSLFLGTP